MRSRSLLVSGLLGGAALLLVACGSEPYAAGGSAVGNENDVNGTQQASGLCTEMTKLPEKCSAAASGAAGACIAKLASTCDGFSKLLNPKLVDAATSCMAEASCDAAPMSCLAKSATALEPTDAQTKLAKAFCDSCSPVSGAACEKTFLSPASPLGKILLPLGDGVANDIGEQCATGITCGATFPTCAQGVVTKALAESLDKDGVECLLTALAGAADSGSSSSSSGGSSSGGSSSGGSSSGGSSSGGSPGPSTPPPASNEPTYDLYITNLEAPAKTASGSAWDAFGGLPDLVVTAEADAGTGHWQNKLTAPVDSLTASFSTPILVNVPQSVFTAPSVTNKLRITVVDADVAFDDAVGDCGLGTWNPVASSFSATSFQPGSGQVTCNASSTGGPGYKLAYRLALHND